MPPTAVMPEMALVTDMSGECSAGGTPSTAWKPARPASEKVVSIAASFGSGERPAARRQPPRTERRVASRAYLRHSGGGASAAASSFCAGGGAGATYASGSRVAPACTSSMPCTASSSRSISYSPCRPVV